jgi:hypothetical protein
MASYPFYTEPTHQTSPNTTAGMLVTQAAGNAARTTTTSSAEGRLIVDVADRIFLLEPTKTPLTTLLTNVGKVWDGKAWVGSSLMKANTGNPLFEWFNQLV